MQVQLLTFVGTHCMELAHQWTGQAVILLFRPSLITIWEKISDSIFEFSIIWERVILKQLDFTILTIGTELIESPLLFPTLSDAH